MASAFTHAAVIGGPAASPAMRSCPTGATATPPCSGRICERCARDRHARTRPDLLSRLPRRSGAAELARRAPRGGAGGAAVHAAHAADRQALLGPDDELRAARLGLGRDRLSLS